MTEIRESVVLQNDGQKVFGMLHLPKGKGPHPAVLICHGLAGHKTGKYRIYVDLSARLTELGIAALRFDYRGCGDSEGDLMHATPEGHVADALAALIYLDKHPQVDSSRIGIYGRSFGGPIAVLAAKLFRNAKSLVLWCPMYNGQQWMDLWQLVQTDSVDDEKKAEMMRINGQQISLLFFEHFFQIDVTSDMDHLKSVPFLHIHGESDTRIGMQHAEDYEKIRRMAEAESKFIRLPNTDHDFSDYKEKQFAIEETCQWFGKTLGVLHDNP